MGNRTGLRQTEGRKTNKGRYRGKNEKKTQTERPRYWVHASGVEGLVAEEKGGSQTISGEM